MRFQILRQTRMPTVQAPRPAPLRLAGDGRDAPAAERAQRVAAVVPGLSCLVTRENISRDVAWRLHERHHTFVVHLGGEISRLETELDGCGTLHHPPMPGELTVVPAGSRYESIAGGGDVRYAEIQLDDRMLRLPDRLAGILRARAGHYDAQLHRQVGRLARLAEAADDVSRMAQEEAALGLRRHLVRAYAVPVPTERGRRVPDGPRLSRTQARMLDELIRDRLDQAMTLQVLAGCTRMTTHQLLSAFRAAFGTSPAQYVIECRLRRARWLLASTRQDISTIALSVGFSSHSHLTGTFTARFGMSPRAFRAASGDTAD